MQDFKALDIQPMPASAKIEIKQLTEQIVKLQELVLTYQNKYIALKRRGESSSVPCAHGLIYRQG